MGSSLVKFVLIALLHKQEQVGLILRLAPYALRLTHTPPSGLMGIVNQPR